MTGNNSDRPWMQDGGKAEAPEEGGRGCPGRCRGGRLVGHPRIVRTSLGCHAVHRGEPVGVSGVDMVNAAESGRACSADSARSRSLPASGMRKGESMSTHHFTLIVDGRDLQGDGVIDALYEAGCDDALIGRSDGIQYAEFDREAAGLVEAVLSAVADIEQVEGVEVVRIADAGLVSMADIAARTGRTREGVRLLVTGARGPGASRHRSRIRAAGTDCGAGRKWNDGWRRVSRRSPRQWRITRWRPSTPAWSFATMDTGWTRVGAPACGRWRD